MTNHRNWRCCALSALALAFAAPSPALADPAMDAQVMHINNQWAHIRYQVGDSNSQYNQLGVLAQQAAQVAAHYPGHAEPLLWQGIVVSEEAARASMLRQLGLATSARDILQKAYSLNPRAAGGGAALSLGVLYAKVPGWPIGFGNSKKARSLFQAALAQDPAGLDNNFFYADFLNAQGDKANARQYAMRALKAPVDATRPVWEAGRRAEVRALLAKINRG
jgi:tetratricopeptide (TPR) repeat protein